MVKACCVAGCEVTVSNDVTLFKLPSSRLLRRKWLKVLAMPDKDALKASVCSRHFLETDYERVRGRTRLKPEVVPTVFQTPITQDPIDEIDNSNNETKTLSSKPKEDSLGETKKDAPNIEAQKELGEPPDVDMKETGELAAGGSDDCDLGENRLNSVNNTDIKGGCVDLRVGKSVEKGSGDVVANKDSDIAEKETESAGVVEAGDLKDDKSTLTKDRQTKDVSEASGSQTLSEIAGEAVTADSEAVAGVGSTDGNVKGEGDKTEGRQKDGVDTSKDGDTVKDSRPEASGSLKPEEAHEDIEDLLTNYHIKQNNIHNIDQFEANKECIDISEPEFPFMENSAPVFIEVAVDQGGTQEGGGSDCLMLLESVQVEVDPEAVMHGGEYEVASVDLDAEDEPSHDNAISLLTSSDEDDVIIQEPKIDTVEVSDETDEDDVPLVRLVDQNRPAPPPGRRGKKKRQRKEREVVVVGAHDYYCVECHFRTSDPGQCSLHRLEHTKVLLMCQLCGYMTSSEGLMAKHERQHKDLKRYQCHLCDYKAKHNMSLIYHLRTHNVAKRFQCSKCDFETSEENDVLPHIIMCRVNNTKSLCHRCDKCAYRTDRPSDLKRHRKRVHRRSDDDDEDYTG